MYALQTSPLSSSAFVLHLFSIWVKLSGVGLDCSGAHNEAAASCQNMSQIIFMTLKKKKRIEGRFQKHIAVFVRFDCLTLLLTSRVVFTVTAIMSHFRGALLHDLLPLLLGFQKKRQCRAEAYTQRWMSRRLGGTGCLCERKLHSTSNRNY